MAKNISNRYKPGWPRSRAWLKRTASRIPGCRDDPQRLLHPQEGQALRHPRALPEDAGMAGDDPRALRRPDDRSLRGQGPALSGDHGKRTRL